MAGSRSYKLGRFELLDHVGGGTSGIVYKARRSSGTRGFRAIKILRPIIADRVPDYVKRLVTEAQVQEAVQGHDHVARVENLLRLSCSNISDDLLSGIEWAVPEHTPQGDLDSYLRGLKCGVVDPKLRSTHPIAQCAPNDHHPRPSGYLNYIVSTWY